MIMKKIALIFLMLLTFISCDDTLTVQDVDNRKIPDKNVSFSQDIYPVFQVKCISCHNATNPDGGLDLTSYSAATADFNIIFPGNPDNSRIVWAIEGNRPPIQPMPPVGYSRPFNDNQRQGIRTWITEGALDN
jgi:hypothetical protein